MNLTREEKETIVRTSDADNYWVISTASPRFIRKFSKLLYKTDDEALNPDGYQSFQVPLNLISFRRQPKELTKHALDAKRMNLFKNRIKARYSQPEVSEKVIAISL
jgi:hypothetical protein